MPIEIVTENRGYQLPFAENDLVDDVARLIAAIAAIDLDVANILVAIATKAAAVHGHTIADTTGLQGALDAKLDAAARGSLDGVASLDATGKVPSSQLPAALFGALAYQGTWNANTNAPTIPSASSANKGFYYKVGTAGATTVDGVNDWKVGDWIVSNGAAWDKVDNTDQVTAVAGLQGAISAASLLSALNLDRLGPFAKTLTDWNSATASGWYMGVGAANAPPVSIVGTPEWCYGRVECFAATYLIQTVWPASNAVTAGDTRTAMRVCVNGSWSGWFRLRFSEAELDDRFVRSAASQALAAGYWAVAANDGSKGAGATYTPTPVGGNLRHASNAGAHTLAAPTATGSYTLVVQYANAAGAGAITLSGFTKTSGDPFTTTVGHRFNVYITKLNGVVTATVEALQ